MPDSQRKYRSQLFRSFLEIEETDFQNIIRFFEENEVQIRHLEFDEYYELLISYVNALFEMGTYQKHLEWVDLVIENSILRNVKYFKGEDIYRKMLFKKAASQYNLRHFDQADYILRELIKIDPFDKDPILFLKKCIRSAPSTLIKATRAISILLFLITAIIIAVEILLIRPFYEGYSRIIEITRISSFVLGLIVLIFGNLYHTFRIDREISEFVQQIQKQKLKES